MLPFLISPIIFHAFHASKLEAFSCAPKPSFLKAPCWGPRPPLPSPGNVCPLWICTCHASWFPCRDRASWWKVLFFFFFCLISHGNPCFYIELIVHVVQFSSSVMSNFLRPHGLQHTRLSSSSPTPRACSDSCALSHWCHPTISSSVTPFCSCLQSFPASGSLPMSQFFTSGVQSIGVSASEIPLELNGLISLQSKGLSRVFSNTIVQKHQFFCTQLSLWSHSHIHIWLL